jgi:hypothetical protein
MSAPGSQQVQHILHPQAVVADARAPATLLRVKGEALCVFHARSLFPFLDPLKSTAATIELCQSRTAVFIPADVQGAKTARACLSSCPRLGFAYEQS